MMDVYCCTRAIISRTTYALPTVRSYSELDLEQQSSSDALSYRASIVLGLYSLCEIDTGMECQRSNFIVF